MNRLSLSVGSFILLTFFLIFTPFSAPLPVPSDVQPHFTFLIIFFLIKFSRKIKFDAIDYLFFIWGLLGAIYTADISLASWKNAYPYFAIPLLAVFVRRFIDYITPKLISYVLIFQSIGFGIQLISPAAHRVIAPLFIRTVKEVEKRNAMSGFATESGLMSGLIFFYFIFILLIRDKYESKRLFWTHISTVSILFVMSLSGTSIIYVILLGGFLVLSFSTNSLKAFINMRIPYIPPILIIITSTFLFIISVFLVLIWINFPAFFSFRFIEVFKIIFRDPRYFLFWDVSVAARMVSLLAGFIALKYAPFGSTLDPDMLYDGYADEVLQYIQVYNKIGMQALGPGNMSSFSEALIILGVFHLVFISILLIISLFNCKRKLEIFGVSIGFLFHLFSFGTLFTPAWLLMVYPLRKQLVFSKS